MMVLQAEIILTLWVVCNQHKNSTLPGMFIDDRAFQFSRWLVQYSSRPLSMDIKSVALDGLKLSGWYGVHSLGMIRSIHGLVFWHDAATGLGLFGRLLRTLEFRCGYAGRSTRWHHSCCRFLSTASASSWSVRLSAWSSTCSLRSAATGTTPCRLDTSTDDILNTMASRVK